MKKEFITAIVITILLIVGVSIFFIIKQTYLNNKNNETNYNSGVILDTNITAINVNEININNPEFRKQKLLNLRKKLELKGLILKGDINLENEEYTSALVKYLQIYKEIPNDESTIQKLGDIYFNLKKFKQAYFYYEKIKNYKKLDKENVITSLLASVDIKNDIQYIINELISLGIQQEQLFYYKNSLACSISFDGCIKSFEEYFINPVNGVEIEELKNIKNAIENYNNFQIEDNLYKQALVSGAFFQNGLYPVAIETGKLILSQKSDYKPILKLVAKSYFELGDYVKAKEYLVKYNDLVKKDSEVSYFMGVIYERLHEYILSTIHFKKALKIGYKDTLDVNKRILFNYYELGEIDKMLSSLKTIMGEDKEKLSTSDYNIAIYYHIVNNQFEDAKKFTKQSLETYPNSEIFNGYMGWILLENINKTLDDKSYNIEIDKNNIYTEAESFIDKGLEINKKSPMLNLVKGKIQLSKGNLSKAFIYFKKTISLDDDGDFGNIAKTLLEKIKIKEK